MKEFFYVFIHVRYDISEHFKSHSRHSSDYPVSVLVVVLLFDFFSKSAAWIWFLFCMDVLWMDPYQVDKQFQILIVDIMSQAINLCKLYWKSMFMILNLD